MKARVAVLAFVALCFFSSIATAQSPGSAQVVEMRVRLVSVRGEPLGDVKGQPGVTAANRTAVGDSVRSSGPNMQIQIRVIDENGSTVGEQFPNSEGVASFRVLGSVFKGQQQFFPLYRIRVHGSEIEETWLENVEPGRFDRNVTIQIRRKGDKAEVTGGSATVSAAALKIPAKAQKELDKGNDALAENKLDSAATHFQKATELYPQFDQAWNNLGVVRMKQGNSAAGKQAFEQALKANDKFARAYVNLARIATQEKDYKKAVELAKSALTVEPLNAEALAIACQSELINGNLDDVIAYAHKLHSIPHDGQGLAHYAAASALATLARPSEAVIEYRMFVKESPESPLVPKAQAAISELSKQAEAQPH